MQRRFAALEAAVRGETVDRAALGLTRADRALARRVLRPHEASWDDGDENLVRDSLERWGREARTAKAATARALLETAGALAQIQPRPQTVWFFLWALESLLPRVAEEAARHR